MAKKYKKKYKKNKKNKKNFMWIIYTFFLIFIIGSSFIIYNIFIDQDDTAIKVRYYKDGIEVNVQEDSKLFGLFQQTIINPGGEAYDQISFDIFVTNTGNVSIDLQIIDASPLVFKNALPATIKTLLVEESGILWSSDLIDVDQFESYPQPVKFLINISGEYLYASSTSYEYTELYLEFISEEIDYLYIEEQLQNDISIDIYNYWGIGQKKLIFNNQIGKIGFLITNPNGVSIPGRIKIKIMKENAITVIDEAILVEDTSMIPQNSQGEWYYANFDNPPMISENVIIVIDFIDGQLPDGGPSPPPQTYGLRGALNILDQENAVLTYNTMPGYVTNDFGYGDIDLVYKIFYLNPISEPKITILNPEYFTDKYYKPLSSIMVGISFPLEISHCYGNVNGIYLHGNIQSEACVLTGSLPYDFPEGEFPLKITIEDMNGYKYEEILTLKTDLTPPVVTLIEDFNSMLTCNGEFMERLDIIAYISDTLSGVNENKVTFKIMEFPAGLNSGWLPMQYSGADDIYVATFIPEGNFKCQSWLNIEAYDIVGHKGIL